MTDLEHMKQPWAVRENTDKGDYARWDIVTDESDPWIVASPGLCLPGDDTGETTAKYICKLHNSKLKCTAIVAP